MGALAALQPVGEGEVHFARPKLVRPLAWFLCKACKGANTPKGLPPCSACQGKGLVLR